MIRSRADSTRNGGGAGVRDSSRFIGDDQFRQRKHNPQQGRTDEQRKAQITPDTGIAWLIGQVRSRNSLHIDLLAIGTASRSNEAQARSQKPLLGDLPLSTQFLNVLHPAREGGRSSHKLATLPCEFALGRGAARPQLVEQRTLRRGSRRLHDFHIELRKPVFRTRRKLDRSTGLQFGFDHPAFITKVVQATQHIVEMSRRFAHVSLGRFDAAASRTLPETVYEPLGLRDDTPRQIMRVLGGERLNLDRGYAGGTIEIGTNILAEMSVEALVVAAREKRWKPVEHIHPARSEYRARRAIPIDGRQQAA